MTTSFDTFDPESVPRGSKRVDYLDVTTLTGGDTLRLAVIVARGARPGPTIAVLGGVHGDEYEGPHAVRGVFDSIDPSDMSGAFIGVPQTNVPAFAAGTRTSPIDGINLARIFPGSKSGTPTERIAHYVAKRIIGGADFLIDLHSSGTRSSMPTLVGYDAREGEVGPKSREAAFTFGAPVVWGHPEVSPGRSVSYAAERGIPWLYTESPGGGWLHPDTAALYARGVANVMKHLGILPGAIEKEEPTHHLHGSGDVDESLSTNAAGYLVSEVKILDRVHKGHLLGRVFGLAGELADEVRADSDGVVVYMRMTPSVMAGDPVYLVTQEAGL